VARRAEALLRLKRRRALALDNVTADGPSAGKRLMILGRPQFDEPPELPGPPPHRGDN
jgi:hypothetical protein